METSPLANGSRPQDTKSRNGEFGERLEYSNPVYQDIWCLVVFWLQVIAIIGICIWFWTSTDIDIDSSSDVSIHFSDYIGIYVAVGVACLIAILFGIFWLYVLKTCAGTIIKTMLFVNLASWLAVVLIGVFVNDSALIFIGAIFLILAGLYTYCVWHRIPFSAELLKLASKVTSKYYGTIIASFFFIFIAIVWYFIWISAFSGYYQYVQTDLNSFVIFLLLVSLYWGIEVWRNVTHTTTCGAAATWYFNDPRQVGSPTMPALKRTMTTSFGSVCFGSLIVAILEAFRAMINMQRGRDSGNACLQCVLVCILECIESLIRYFNSYAYAQIAIYGLSFMQAAKNTWDLFSSMGFTMIINDDLTGMALFAGSMLGAVVSATAGYFISYAYLGNTSEYHLCAFAAAVSGLLGLVLCFQLIYVVRSSIICLFVCLAEDPEALRENHPVHYANITDAKPEIIQNQQRI